MRRKIERVTCDCFWTDALCVLTCAIMATTPGRLGPRQSGLPTPGRISGLPTPGRSRSSSNAHQLPAPIDPDTTMRAFEEAIKRNDPSQHRNSRQSDIHQPITPSGRRSAAGRPSSTTSAGARATPRHSTSSKAPPVSQRPSSRASDVGFRSSSRASNIDFELGSQVRIESLGHEGTLRYVGPLDDKPGIWAGVELSGGFAGMGKNSGDVAGYDVQCFLTRSCTIQCGCL